MVKQEPRARFVSGPLMFAVTVRIWARLTVLALFACRSPRQAFTMLRKLILLRRNFAGAGKHSRILKAQGRYYWHMHLPGFPSPLFDDHFTRAISRLADDGATAAGLVILYLGITRKCPLRCLHCYNWLESEEFWKLDLEGFVKIGHAFQDRGLTQVHILGGEPMTCYDNLLELVMHFSQRSEVWFSTSGYLLDAAKAHALRTAGLTGVAISIDHFVAEEHNRIRGHRDAFDWALKATESCNDAGLITCWSIVMSEEMARPGQLMSYAEKAASYKVGFIQLFEPMPSGRFKGRDVRISPDGILNMERFFTGLNRDKRYHSYPLVIYTGYHQRRLGCLGRGNRFLYVDSNGTLHPCPFCRSVQRTDILSKSYDECMAEVKKGHCLYNDQYTLQNKSGRRATFLIKDSGT